VRAWELLAAVTTTTTTSTSGVTTTTLVQAVGGQGGDSVINVWVPLLAALLGAIVGGLLALVGSVLVKRWELRKTTRIRIYDDLLPALYRHYSGTSITEALIERGFQIGHVPVPTKNFMERVGEIRRAGVVAGWREAQITKQIWDLISEHTTYGMQSNLIWHYDRDLSAMDRELERLVVELNKHLERKLTSGFRRRSRLWRTETLRGEG
jgi:hypothetical protein